MRIDDLRISSRLVLGFALLGLMVLAMVAAVWVQLSAMTGLFGDVAGTRMPRMVAANAIKEDVQVIGTSVRNMILMSDGAAIRAEDERIQRTQQRIAQRFAGLQQLLAGDAAAEAALARVQAARQAYEPLQEEARDLSASGQVFDAKELLVEKMHPAQQAYLGAIDALLAQQQGQLEQATGATERAATSVRSVLLGVPLVDRAGATMHEVVAAIARATALMGEISRASDEQRAGVAQIGEAIAQMDHVTQQNAALVKQVAASAGSLGSQAQELVNAVAVFRVDEAQATSAGLLRLSN